MKMLRIPVAAAVLLSAAAACAGTLIFRNAATGTVDIISRTEITAIADGMAQLGCGKGRDREYFAVALSDIVRFDEEDINVDHRPLDDGSIDYALRLVEVIMPTKSKPNEFRVVYSIMRELSAGRESAIRRPYIFVTVLTETAGRDGSRKRKRTVLSSPASASSGLRAEAGYMKVIEKLLDPAREMWYPEDDKSHGPSSRSRANPEEIFKIPGSNTTLLAYQVTIWGKYQIADSKTWIDNKSSVEADWLTRQY